MLWRRITAAARWALALAIGSALCAPGRDSLGGGLQLPTRGVRPTARGGAFVAGADDLGALWFNPAGLLGSVAEGQHDILVDVGYVRQDVEYTRIDSGNNRHAAVANGAPGMPIPTVAYGRRRGDRGVLAVGLYAPYGALGSYPDGGPQRYSLVDMSRSVLAIAEVALAHRVSPRLRLGAGLQNLILGLSVALVVSGCPAPTLCAPEDPEFDALVRVQQLDLLNPSAVAGAQYDFSPRVRGGIAFQLPFFVSGRGRMAVRMPSSGLYQNATLVGSRADVSFVLPPILRVGVQVEPAARWRVEIGAAAEFWHVHDRLRIEPKDVYVDNLPGVGRYQVAPIELIRGFQDAFAVNLGVEGQILASVPVRALVGYSYETAAAPLEYLSVLAVDGGKHLVAAGLAYGGPTWELSAMLGYAALGDRRVATDVGVAEQITPLGNSDGSAVYVNWGDYSSFWLMAGASARLSF